MLIELNHNDSDEYVEDVLAGSQYLTKIKDLTQEIDVALGNLTLSEYKINEQQERINILENRLINIRSSLNLTGYRLEDAKQKKQELKPFDLKARLKNRKEIANIEETLADLRGAYSRAKQEIQTLSNAILTQTEQNRYDTMKKNIFNTIRELSVTIKEYRQFRDAFSHEYHIKLPEVNFCDVISTTPEGKIMVFPKEIPYIATTFAPQPCLTSTEIIDGIEYEVEPV